MMSQVNILRTYHEFWPFSWQYYNHFKACIFYSKRWHVDFLLSFCSYCFTYIKMGKIFSSEFFYLHLLPILSFSSGFREKFAKYNGNRVNKAKLFAFEKPTFHCFAFCDHNTSHLEAKMQALL
jgi:hypothetical protein